jgi:hypothetical protein
MLVAPAVAVVANAGQLRQTEAPVVGMYVLKGHGVGAEEP